MADPNDLKRSSEDNRAPDEAPDAWADADRAYAAKWSDDPDAARPADDVEPLPPPPPGYTPASELQGMRAAGPYLGLGIQIAASMAVFTGGGFLVGRWLGSETAGLLVGAGLGMAGIIALVVRVARDADARKAARKKTGQP